MGSWSAGAEPFVRAPADATLFTAPSIPYSHSISWLFSGAALMGRQSCRNVINVGGAKAAPRDPACRSFVSSFGARLHDFRTERSVYWVKKNPIFRTNQHAYTDFVSRGRTGRRSKDPNLFLDVKTQASKPPLVNLTCSGVVVL